MLHLVFICGKERSGQYHKMVDHRSEILKIIQSIKYTVDEKYINKKERERQLMKATMLAES